MLKLIRLELKKHRIDSMILTAFLISLSVLGLMVLVGFIEKFEGLEAFAGYGESLMITETLLRIAFVIYASVLIAKFVIEEYKSKTISVLFSYPISRKKLIAAKLVIIFVFTLGALLISNLIVTAAFLYISEQFALVTEPIDADRIREHAIYALFQSVSAAGVSLIPMFFGMMKKSVPVTIVSSVLIVSVLSSNNAGFSLSSIIAIPIAFGCIGILLAWLSVRKVDSADVV